MKKKIRNFTVKERIKLAGAFAPAVILGNAMTAFAKEETTGVTEVTNGINILTTLILACVAGVGVIFLAIGLLDFGAAYSAHDTTQQSIAIKKVIGALIMIAVPAILKLMGAV